MVEKKIGVNFFICESIGRSCLIEISGRSSTQRLEFPYTILNLNGLDFSNSVKMRTAEVS